MEVSVEHVAPCGHDDLAFLRRWRGSSHSHRVVRQARQDGPPGQANGPPWSARQDGPLWSARQDGPPWTARQDGPLGKMLFRSPTFSDFCAVPEHQCVNTITFVPETRQFSTFLALCFVTC